MSYPHNGGMRHTAPRGAPRGYPQRTSSAPPAEDKRTASTGFQPDKSLVRTMYPQARAPIPPGAGFTPAPYYPAQYGQYGQPQYTVRVRPPVTRRKKKPLAIINPTTNQKITSARQQEADTTPATGTAAPAPAPAPATGGAAAAPSGGAAPAVPAATSFMSAGPAGAYPQPALMQPAAPNAPALMAAAAGKAKPSKRNLVIVDKSTGKPVVGSALTPASAPVAPPLPKPDNSGTVGAAPTTTTTAAAAASPVSQASDGGSTPAVMRRVRAKSIELTNELQREESEVARKKAALAARRAELERIEAANKELDRRERQVREGDDSAAAAAAATGGGGDSARPSSFPRPGGGLGMPATQGAAPHAFVYNGDPSSGRKTYSIKDLYAMRPNDDVEHSMVPFEVVASASSGRGGGGGGGGSSWNRSGGGGGGGRDDRRGGHHHNDRDSPRERRGGYDRHNNSNNNNNRRGGGGGAGGGAGRDEGRGDFRTGGGHNNNNSGRGGGRDRHGGRGGGGGGRDGGRHSGGGAGRGGGGGGGGGSHAGRDDDPRGMKMQDFSLLNTAKNAWKPDKPTEGIEAVLRKVKGILNKITMDNFDRLSKQMLAIPMSSLEMLTEVIRTVFDEALNFPAFGEMFATLCHHLAANTKAWNFIRIVESGKGYQYSTGGEGSTPLGPGGKPDRYFSSKADAQRAGEKATNFKRILLNKCQVEFEKNNLYAEIEREAAEDAANTSLTPRERRERELLRLETTGKIKRRMLGNIRFIGELYKKSMLTDRIMHHCVTTLLNHGNISNPDEEDTEALCKLVTTVGKAMDATTNPEFRKAMNTYFDLFKQLANHKTMTPRLRFLCRDVVELRQSKWKPRREESKLKTIEQFRQDEKKAQKKKSLAAMRSQMGGSGGRHDRYDNRNSRKDRESREQERKKHQKQQQDLAKRVQAARDQARAGTAGGARRSGAPKLPGGGAPKLALGGGGAPKLALGGSRLGMGRKPAPATRSSSSSGGGAGGGAGASGSASSAASAAARSGKAYKMDKDKLRKTVHNIVDEYKALKQFDEVKASMEELGALAAAPLALECIKSVEDKSDFRAAAAELLPLLTKAKLVGEGDIAKALATYADPDTLSDLLFDFPNILSNLAQVLGPAVAAAGFSLAKLRSTLTPLEASGQAGVVYGRTLAVAAKASSVAAVAALKPSNVLPPLTSVTTAGTLGPVAAALAATNAASLLPDVAALVELRDAAATTPASLASVVASVGSAFAAPTSAACAVAEAVDAIVGANPQDRNYDNDAITAALAQAAPGLCGLVPNSQEGKVQVLNQLAAVVNTRKFRPGLVEAVFGGVVPAVVPSEAAKAWHKSTANDELPGCMRAKGNVEDIVNA